MANRSDTDLTPSPELDPLMVLPAEFRISAPLPPEREDLYSGEMDSDTRKLLNELPARIADGISNGLASSRPQPPASTTSVPNVKVDNWEWIKRIGSILAVLVVVAGANLYVISSEINKALTIPSQTLVKLGADLNAFDQRLKQVEARSLPAILSAPLPKNEEQRGQDLERRSDALEAAIQQKLPTYPDTLPAVSSFRMSLAALQPGGGAFWKAVTSAINYQTFLVRQMTLFAETRCEISLPAGRSAVDTFVSGIVLDGCQQQLDIGVNWETVTFRHSIIVYKGGALHLKNVTFDDCVFMVSFPDSPTQPAQVFAKYLLTAEKMPASLKIAG